MLFSSVKIRKFEKIFNNVLCCKIYVYKDCSGLSFSRILLLDQCQTTFVNNWHKQCLINAVYRVERPDLCCSREYSIASYKLVPFRDTQ